MNPVRNPIISDKIGRAYAVLSSKGVLVWLSSLWLVYYVSSAIWSKEAFAGFIHDLGHSLITQSLFVLFLLCSFLNLVRSSFNRYKKGLFRLALWIFLPAGLFLLLAGYFISANLRHDGKLLVGEGSEVKFPWMDKPLEVSEVKAPLEEDLLDMKTEGGSFLKYFYEKSAYLKYEPKAALLSGTKKYEVGAFPPSKVGGTYFHILNAGLAPGVRLSDKTGTLSDGYMALFLLPPGVEDSFALPGYPYKFKLRIAPDKIIEKGRTVARLYTLKSPSYEVSVIKGDDTVFTGNSKDGIRFDGLELSFFEPSYWVLLEAAKDPGIPVIASALVLITLGIPTWTALMILDLVIYYRRRKNLVP